MPIASIQKEMSKEIDIAEIPTVEEMREAVAELKKRSDKRMKTFKYRPIYLPMEDVEYWRKIGLIKHNTLDMHKFYDFLSKATKGENDGSAD